MYKSYNCAGNRAKPFQLSCCDSKPDHYTYPELAVIPKGIPESTRMLNERCSEAIITIQPPVCSAQSDPIQSNPVVNTSTNLSYNKILVPVLPGYPMPIQTVGTIAASSTTQQRALSVIQQESDTYNPDTRFRQYFPPAPTPYQCPERIPNNYPLPSTAPCLPIQRYQPSSKN